jgi:uroporphyrinogen-III synthase
MAVLPLGGRRVLVTRAQHQAGKLSEGLRAVGAIPVEVPVLEIAPPLDFSRLDAALSKLETYDWLLFTSANTVRAVDARRGQLGLHGESARVLVAAVGPATAAAARESGWDVALVPEAYVAESLVAALQATTIAGKRVLLARAEVARDVVPDALRQAGAVVDVVDAYRNRIPEAAPGQLREALVRGLDAATFTSSSSVTHLRDCAAWAGSAWPFRDVPAVSIGPVTSETLRESGWAPAIEAAPHDIPGLVAAVVRLFSGRTGRER